MVVDDLDVIGIIIVPCKADTPLVVDPDTMLAFPVTMQCFQVIGRRNPQGFKEARGIEHLEFNNRRPLNCSWKSCGEPSVEQLLGFFAFK